MFITILFFQKEGQIKKKMFESYFTDFHCLYFCNYTLNEYKIRGSLSHLSYVPEKHKVEGASFLLVLAFLLLFHCH